jgi:hypothetical protein
MNSEQPDSPCNLCGQIKDLMYEDVCRDCIEQTLLKHLSHLKRALEDKFGQMLDQWLAAGRFKTAQWTAGIDLYLCRERLRNFVWKMLSDAVRKGDIKLMLSPGQFWRPLNAHQFLNSIQKQCEDDFLRLLGSLFLAITKAPTQEAERELIEIASGRKQINKRYVREEAITVLVTAKSTPLLLPTRALIELRYRADGGRQYYTNVRDGEISSVWNEIKESLPMEVARLITEDGSW